MGRGLSCVMMDETLLWHFMSILIKSLAEHFMLVSLALSALTGERRAHKKSLFMAINRVGSREEECEACSSGKKMRGFLAHDELMHTCQLSGRPFFTFRTYDRRRQWCADDFSHFTCDSYRVGWSAAHAILPWENVFWPTREERTLIININKQNLCSFNRSLISLRALRCCWNDF